MTSTLALLEIQDPGNLQNTIITIKGAEGSIVAGAQGIPGQVSLRDKTGRETIYLNGQTGELTQSGDIILKDQDGNERVRISGKTAEILIKNAGGVQVTRLGKDGNLDAGGGEQDGELILRDKAGNATIYLGAEAKNLIIQNNRGERVVELGRNGDLYLGGGGMAGDLVVRNEDGSITARIDGQTAKLHLGASGQAGDVLVNNTAGQATIHLNGRNGEAVFDGNVEIKQDLTVAGKTTTKDLTVTGTTNLQQGLETSELTAKNITVTNSSGSPTIRLLGDQGDIQLLNADCAEDFDIVETEDIEPGTVMVLDQQGRLCSSSVAYDKKVAGVISGAGDYKPGLVLDKQMSSNKRLPVALMGKVYCKVDAAYAPVEVGDLLTTSTTPGHAMKAANPLQAFGAVIGKALQPLDAGRGLIPVLVALQ